MTARVTVAPSPLALAAEVPRWAASFYWRHAAWIVGLSLIPAAQRVVAQLWGDRLPPLAAGLLEALTLLVRVVLLALIFRAAILRNPELEPVGEGRWSRATRFVRRQWRSLLVQFALLLAFAGLCKVVPDLLVAPRIPPEWSRTYWAGLLAVKNPTVIAFTMVWIVGTVRQMLLPHESAAAETAPLVPGHA